MASSQFNITKDRLNQLLDGYIRQELSAEERQELLDWAANPVNELSAKSEIEAVIRQYPHAKAQLSTESAEEILESIFQADTTEIKYDSLEKPIRRIHILRKNVFRYAAAILLLVGATGIWYITSKRSKDDQRIVNNNNDPQSDIAPGGDKAILILADGSRILLDSAANGNLANQGGAQIVKLANGQIAYNLQNWDGKEAMLNTMTTPKGGQYQITLPDGTKVWLNASSSITFPTVFTGNKREVKTVGEVYFEVAKNKEKPFLVKINEQSVVEVLGTSFNINSYVDEGSITTTLLEGSVKVKNLLKSVILNPGQRATIPVIASSDKQSGNNTAGIIVNSGVDLDQTLAWKNGLFNFNGADLHTVMRQLERWYDIKVQYKSAVSNIVFQGKMYRNVNLSDVLRMLKKMGVRFELEGKNLIIL